MLRLATPLLISASALTLAACNGQAPADPRTEPPRIRAASVREASEAFRSFTGTLAARVESDLGFRVSGKVMQRLVDAGQSVRRGQALMRIDPVDLRLAAQAQQEAVAAAQARARQTAEDEARYRDLRGTGAISASAYDQVKAAADAAQAQLHAAQAQADVALNATRYTELLADGDGVVMETLVEPGQVVSAGQTVVRLAHAGPREAVIHLPETLRPAIGSAARATIFGKEGVAIPARLRQLSSSADRLTRTFEARYVLDGDAADLPLGATVTVSIAEARSAAQAAVQVPIGALFDAGAGKGQGVWVISGEPARVAWRAVRLQHLDDSSARVTGALRPGERVVALGAHLLREGEQVRVAEPAVAAMAEGAHP